MGRIGRLIKTEIEKFIVQTVESYLGKNQLCRQYGPSGDDSPPLSADRVILVKVDGTGRYVSAGVLSVSQGANPGEKILYSRNENNEAMALIKMLQDGELKFMAAADVTIDSDSKVLVQGGGKAAARKGDKVKVTIPAGSFITTVSGGAGAPAVGVANVSPVTVEGTIEEGSDSVEIG